MNQCLKLRNRSTGSNLVDVGRDAVRDGVRCEVEAVNSVPDLTAGGEATLKACGVGVAMLPE